MNVDNKKNKVYIYLFRFENLKIIHLNIILSQK